MKTSDAASATDASAADASAADASAADAFAQETLAERTLDVLGARSWADWAKLLQKWPLDEFLAGQLREFVGRKDYVIRYWLGFHLSNLKSGGCLDFSERITDRVRLLATGKYISTSVW